MVAMGRPAGVGSTVAVVIFRVLFCFKFGGLWIDGGREIFFSGFFFFFLKLLPQLFQAAMFKRMTTPPHTPTETIVIRSDSGKSGLLSPKPQR